MTLLSQMRTNLEVAGLTDVGRVRQVNEDTWAHGSFESGELLIVCDGMGGHRTGEVASGLAREAMLDTFRRNQDKNQKTVPDLMSSAFERGNRAVFDHAKKRAESRGMGTTGTAAIVDGPNLIIGHVGDSRAYLWRDGQLRQLTRDHSWVAEQVRQGALSLEESRNHRWRNVITNALGAFPNVKVDLFGHVLRQGDTILLCSDGLCGVISDSEISACLQRNQLFSAEQAVAELVSLANLGGGPDNITVVLLRAHELLESTNKTYAIPRLPEEQAVHKLDDPEPDVKSTYVLEPKSQKKNNLKVRPWLLALLVLVYLLVFLLVFLR